VTAKVHIRDTHLARKTIKLLMMKHLLPLLLIIFSSAVLAESGAYRVEVIVFRNLAVIAEAGSVEELRSFSHFPDLEKPKPAERNQALEDSQGAENLKPGETSNEEPPGGMPLEQAGVLPGDMPEAPRIDLPDDLRVISDRESYMDAVWRRLRSSEKYQPLVYAAWEQNRTDYYPPMRIHDQQIIDRQLRPPTNIMIADLTADDPLFAYRSNFYQLDGSAQLKRSRFLHIFLDLEYREQKSPDIVEWDLPAENGIQVDYEASLDEPSEYQLFTLKQNRQIRTNQVQYFDTPVLGALVFVTAISAE